ncbi:MAG: fluoride efflux transporter CrcB [Sulfurospirillaceae bacterium]|nr:fluoride efflux transporter CrcB [Sulfurospirillaceae bacterium]
MIQTVFAIASGAGIGALLRWFLGVKLNAFYPAIPFGTLSSNLLGGYLIGLAMAFFATNSAISPEWKLFIITGFLGGLTTFSTFSAEIVSSLQQGRFFIALSAVGLHVVGSVAMTFLGIATYVFFQNRSL